MAGVPLNDILDPALPLFVERTFGGRDMRGEFGAPLRVPTAQHQGIQFQQVLMLAHDKNVDARIHQGIDVGITRQRIFDDLVAHRVPLPAQLLVDDIAFHLHPTQGYRDRIQIQRRSHLSSGCWVYCTASNAARARIAKSVGREI